MSGLYPSLKDVTIVATAFKLLLLPAYKSTDFEVHRNWLALTHSLPVQKWYYENTSEWTLDYPPFFAAFEWCMSHVAKYFDPRMLEVQNLGYDSFNTVLFQRLSVIVTELVMVYALHRLVANSPEFTKRSAHAIALSILLSPGLLIIDHIHFQYNGFMYGILLLSLLVAKSSPLLSGILFAALLCFKHIYLYLAPAYFIYLLRAYCLGPNFSIWPPNPAIQFFNSLKLGVSIITIFATAFAPFVWWGQIPQLLSRLFPFARGLCHAYWAPNIWAMYSFMDRCLILIAPKLGLAINQAALSSGTRGLVGNTSFAVLPDITPRVTFVLTLLFMALPLVKLFMHPTYENFLGSVTLCAFSSFLFGWHVHEKAILLIIFPFSLLALNSRHHLSSFRPLAVAGHVSLFPLLFTPAEFPIKTVYTVLWLIVFLYTFDKLAPSGGVNEYRRWLMDRPATLFVIVAIPLVTYCSLIHGLVFGDRLGFMPLMFMSSYSAVGVVASWVWLMGVYLSN
ncbi:Similar to Dolichyl pyrophosphate Glc1Man9GlcNAc2 alpha-1,3-glucosyltransferase; acc. no. Q4IJT0 [Pyronema omphalodes CBS 100304]|uniref:Alpha-1,3-glucosyltransferase n=1 Tax=Pyronema omphalodes (strain CBS 100304) TaxID=1076935 RepID=U4KWQ6_PYROM|nr:Similar to Dolichyl pyrophosphate Glc1Man9GlcNAc2 alpha-1,3-glucosyltransferase; acc. no. Q4IJT0 [Pyronema omphalodes CBS 100304]